MRIHLKHLSDEYTPERGREGERERGRKGEGEKGGRRIFSLPLTLSPSHPFHTLGAAQRARLLVSWLMLSAVVLSLGLRVDEMPPRRAAPYYAVADTDTVDTKTIFVDGDTLRGTEENDEVVRYYIGNVEGKQDSTYLNADWAKHFVAREQVLMTGNVLIVDQGDSLYADTVFYDGLNKIGRAQGRVRLADGEVVALAPSGLYFIDEKRARFSKGLRLVDSTAEMTSRTGTYWTEEKRAELEGDVHLQAERTYLEADSLTYFRDNEISIARGNVFIDRIGGEGDNEADSTIRTLLFSQWAYNDEPAGLSRIRGRPLLVQLRQDSTDAEVDTLVIRALRLEALEQDTLRRLIAVDSVRIWQPDLAATADSVIYERYQQPAAPQHPDSLPAYIVQADSLMADSLQALAAPPDTVAERIEETRLYRGPMLWVDEAQISGDTIRVRGQGSEVDSLFVRQNAFVAQRDTLLDRINQLRGQNLTGFFEDDSVRIFVVGPNAETIYFQRDEEDRPDGGLQVSGDQAIFRFRGDDPEDIKFGEHQGAYYPESVLPTPFELEGFRWLPEQRPQKADLLQGERVLRVLAPPDTTAAAGDAAPPQTSENKGAPRRGNNNDGKDR